MWPDYLLYEHFKKKFMKERETYGLHRLNHEKGILKKSIDRVKELCIEGQVIIPQYSDIVMRYKLKQNSTDASCPYYTMTETNFINDIRVSQQHRSREKRLQRLKRLKRLQI